MKRELSVLLQQQEEPNRHLKGTHRQMEPYFLDHYFHPSGTSGIFVDYL